MNVTVLAGETRHIRLQIRNTKNETFSILEASAVLVDSNGNVEPVNVNIIDHILDAVVSPKEVGIYHLRYTYTIADETMIDCVKVSVNQC